MLNIYNTHLTSYNNFPIPTSNREVEILDYTAVDFHPREFFYTITGTAPFNTIEKDKKVAILAKALNNLQRTLDYNGHYAAYLSGNITLEEFESIAEDFAQERITGKKIATEEMKALIPYLDGNYDASTFVNMLNIDITTVQSVLAEINGSIKKTTRNTNRKIV